MKKRFWALFLAVMMVVSVLPTSALAAQGDNRPNGPSYPGNGGVNDDFVSVDGEKGDTGTVTFRIINGTWTGLPTNTSSGVSFTANEVTFTTKWYSKSNRSGYVYECSNTDDGDNANGAYFETFLLAILGENGEQFIKPNTGYKVDSMDWDFGDDTEGLVNNSGTANVEMEWLSTMEDGYLNIHQCDDNASLQDCFPAKAVYELTLHPYYTVSFDETASDPSPEAEDITGAPEDISQVKVNSTITEPEAPRAEGWTFEGWYTERACETKWDFANDKVTEDITLYAKWSKPQYTVTYTWTGDIPDGVSLPEKATVTAGGTHTVSAAPSKDGYTFDGWKKDNAVVTGDITVNADIELTGVWTKIPTYTYTLTYDANGGEGAPAADKEEDTTAETYTFTVSATEPTLDGYTFLGWATSAEATEAEYEAGDEITLTKNAPTETLYAVWEEIPTYTYTLTYDANGGEGAPAADKEEDTTAETYTFTVSATEPTLDGYTFLGWATNEDATAAEYEAGAEITLTKDDPAETLYAVWEEIPTYTYTLTYDANGGEGAPVADKEEDTTAETYTFTVSATEPTLDGYTFLGWATSAEATEAEYEAGDEITLTKDDPAETLYAIWEEIPTYTLTFNANGGAWDAAVEGFEMNSDSNVVTKVSEYSYTLDPITQPVRDGYKFTGWYNEDIQSGAIALAGQSLRLDLILYAGWEEIQPDDVKYTVRKHYIGADGNEAAAVNLIDQTGKEGTAINTIIANYAKDQTYYGQNYTYAADKTTVEPDVEKLEAGVVIDLYYYLDTWNDEKDSITEGDDIPDMYQAAVEFKAAVNGTVGKDGEKLIQVYTNKENNVVFTPSVVTPVANEGYAFDVWYKDADFDASVDPFVETTVAGGTKIVYTATFAKDVIGGDNGGDTIPDKYQAVVTYVVKNGTWDGTDADSKQAVFTLYEKIGGVWTPKTGVTLGDTIPTGMEANATHIQSSGEWDVDIDENTAVTGDATYTYEFKTTKAPSIEVTKTVNKTSAEIGDTLTYTIVVENKGNVDLNNVIVTDAWLNKSETIATLAKGESKTFIYTYKVVGADAGKTLKNTVIAKADNLPEEKGDTAETKIKKNDPVKPVGPSKPALNKADHYAYIVGYPDGLVHPEKNITRAEVSTIFFRMLLDESREDFWAQENWFSDVPAHMWFNNAVSTLANAGLITGYPDGSFKPNANITRAEFATIAIRFFLEEDVEITENNLSDVKGHWAEANINLAYALNLINGYPDGTFRPDQKITRAEAMTIVNRVLERAPEKDHLLDDMIEWPDNMNKDAWYYAAVQEATNSHEFYRDSENEHEVWTELLPVRDWAALEQEWSQANSSKNPGEVVDINVSTPEAGN